LPRLPLGYEMPWLLNATYTRNVSEDMFFSVVRCRPPISSTPQRSRRSASALLPSGSHLNKGRRDSRSCCRRTAACRQSRLACCEGRHFFGVALVGCGERLLGIGGPRYKCSRPQLHQPPRRDFRVRQSVVEVVPGGIASGGNSRLSGSQRQSERERSKQQDHHGNERARHEAFLLACESGRSLLRWD
jgi:hypothetical protein